MDWFSVYDSTILLWFKETKNVEKLTVCIEHFNIRWNLYMWTFTKQILSVALFSRHIISSRWIQLHFLYYNSPLITFFQYCKLMYVHYKWKTNYHFRCKKYKLYDCSKYYAESASFAMSMSNYAIKPLIYMIGILLSYVQLSVIGTKIPSTSLARN